MEINYNFNNHKNESQEQVGKALAEGAVAAMLEAAFPTAGKRDSNQNSWFKPSNSHLPEVELTGQKAGEALGHALAGGLAGAAARAIQAPEVHGHKGQEPKNNEQKNIGEKAGEAAAQIGLGVLVGRGARAVSKAGGAQEHHKVSDKETSQAVGALAGAAAKLAGAAAGGGAQKKH